MVDQILENFPDLQKNDVILLNGPEHVKIEESTVDYNSTVKIFCVSENLRKRIDAAFTSGFLEDLFRKQGKVMSIDYKHSNRFCINIDKNIKKIGRCYKCAICSLRFVTSDNLRDHFKHSRCETEHKRLAEECRSK